MKVTKRQLQRIIREEKQRLQENAMMSGLTETQKNFIQRAVEAYDQVILEEIMGVPDEMERVPGWARDEIFDLLKLTQ